MPSWNIRPEITEMQAKAIFTAAMNVAKTGKIVLPEIMIPLAVTKREHDILKEIIVREHDLIEKEYKVKIPFKYGTMIEIPRAALLADELAQTAEFFSFGTNDLTQTTFGISRDNFTYHDCYKKLGILDSDPRTRSQFSTNMELVF